MNVTTVNVGEGFDWHNDTVEDQVHPSASGARKMADQWPKALLPLLQRAP